MLPQIVIKYEFSEPPAYWAAPDSRRHGEGTSDETLVKSLAEGNKHGLQVLFARHNVRIFRFVVSLVRDESLAEDLVGDVFLEVWRHPDKFGGRSQISTWLLKIARNKAIAARRRCSDAQPDEEMETAIDAISTNPDATIIKRDWSAVFRKCLRTQLSSRHREVIDLVYYHGKTIGEVAQIIGTSDIAVKTRMSSARKQLEPLLKSAGINRACH
jgi:RNA polymerase sigma-70 factor (ECF subfamily)